MGDLCVAAQGGFILRFVAHLTDQPIRHMVPINGDDRGHANGVGELILNALMKGESERSSNDIVGGRKWASQRHQPFVQGRLLIFALGNILEETVGTVELSAGGFADLAVIGHLETGAILFHQRKINRCRYRGKKGAPSCPGNKGGERPGNGRGGKIRP